MVLAQPAQPTRDQAQELTNVEPLVPNVRQMIDNTSQKMVSVETVNHIQELNLMEYVDQISVS